MGRATACLVVAGVAMALSGCSRAGGPRPAGAGTSVPTTSAGSAPTTSGSGSAAASARPVTSTAPAALPFNADTNPDVSTVRDGNPVLVSVTKGEHAGYVRYVFRFNHSDPDGHQPWRKFAQPPWDVRYVPQSDAVQDGSGKPVVNVGAPAHLRIRFDANMHDGAEGQNTLQTSVSDEDALAFGGDFEGQVRWFYGSDRERPFRVFYAGDGRVVVDIVA